MSTQPQSPLDRLAGLATLGTRRAPLPKELDWPDATLAPLGTGDKGAETRLLRAAAASALFEAAGVRAAPEAVPAVSDFPAAGAPCLAEAAAWRLARIVGGEHRPLLAEWLELAGTSGRIVPPHFLPLILDGIPPGERRGAGRLLGPAATWLASRHPNWIADAPVTEPSEQRWKEGSLSERLAELEALRLIDRARSREWLRSTWEQDPPDAREAFVLALLPTVAPDDEEFLELALDDKRKSVRQAATEGLARLPLSAHARRNLARLGDLLALGAGRRRKLAIELPTAPDKAALRDGIESKVPAGHKIGERAFWLVQMVALVPPRHWCQRFDCDAKTFLDAVLASDYAQDLLKALTEAAARHYVAEWSSLLISTWIASGQEFPTVLESVTELVSAAAAADRVQLAEHVVREARTDHFGIARTLLSSLEIHWSRALTDLAFDRLADLAKTDKSDYSQPRNSLDNWARHCDCETGARRGAALLEKCGEKHGWRNALEQFNDIVAFRAAMREELKK